MSWYPSEFLNIFSSVTNAVMDRVKEISLREMVTGNNINLSGKEKLRRAEKSRNQPRTAVVDYPLEEIKDFDAQRERVLRLLKEVCEKMGEPLPAVTIEFKKEKNAFCRYGERRVGINLSCLYEFTDGEIKSVLGHEMAHFNQDKTAELNFSRFYKLASYTPVAALGYAAYYVHYYPNQALEYLEKGLDFGVEAASKLHQLGSVNEVNQLAFSTVQEMKAHNLDTFLYTGCGILCSAYLLKMYESRINEYKADRAGAEVAGVEEAISAEEKLHEYQKERCWVSKVAGRAAEGFALSFNKVASSKGQPELQVEDCKRSFTELVYTSAERVLSIINTHPPGQSRIKALEKIRDEKTTANPVQI